jgi:hypothetical protein
MPESFIERPVIWMYVRSSFNNDIERIYTIDDMGRLSSFTHYRYDLEYLLEKYGHLPWANTYLGIL